MTSTLPPLVQACSGAVGSATANAISYPLDLVATRLQTLHSKKSGGISGAIRVLQQAIEREGICGLYSGLWTDTGATVLSNFLYFYAYTFIRNFLSRRKASPSASIPKKSILLSVPEELAVGFVAGVISRAISTPLSVITARLQTANDEQEEEESRAEGKRGEADIKEETGLKYVVRSIYEERGLAGFWKGFETTVLLSLNPSITFFLYQVYRRIFLRGTDRQAPNPRQAFFGAAFANALAVTILYPLILAKTRLQTSRAGSSSSLSSAPYIWRSAYERDGWHGLYQGLEAQIFKGFLSQGVTMMVKQRIEQLVVALYAR